MLIKPALENIEEDKKEKIKEIKTQSPVAQSILKFYEHSANSTSYTPIRQNILNKDRDIIYSVSTEQKIVKEELPNQLRMDIRWDKMQIFQDLYVILPVGNELWIIDQHAAHERILYEKFKNNVNEQKKISQELLFPITIDINKQQANLLTELIPYLENLGIIIEDFGNDSIIIRSIPVFIKESKIKYIIYNTIDDIMELEFNFEKLINKFDEVLKIMSCRSAIKAGDEVSGHEIKLIMQEIFRLDIWTCPHGRPVVLRFSVESLEKMFHRK